MLTIVIGTLAAAFIAVAITLAPKRSSVVEVVGTSLLFAMVGAVVSLAVAAILSLIPIHSVEANSEKYSLSINIFNETSWYVSSRIDDGKVYYSVQYIEEDGSLKYKNLSAESVVFTYTDQRPYIKKSTMTVPDSWKLWTICKDKYVYEIGVNAINYIKPDMKW